MRKFFEKVKSDVVLFYEFNYEWVMLGVMIAVGALLGIAVCMIVR